MARNNGESATNTVGRSKVYLQGRELVTELDPVGVGTRAVKHLFPLAESSTKGRMVEMKLHTTSVRLYGVHAVTRPSSNIHCY